MDLLHHAKAFDSDRVRVDSLGIVVVSSYLSSAHFPKFVLHLRRYRSRTSESYGH